MSWKGTVDAGGGLSGDVRSDHARSYGHHPARGEAGRPARHRGDDQHHQIADVRRRRTHRDGEGRGRVDRGRCRSEEHTSELQSLMRISYAVFCLKKKNTTKTYSKQ